MQSSAHKRQPQVLNPKPGSNLRARVRRVLCRGSRVRTYRKAADLQTCQHPFHPSLTTNPPRKSPSSLPSAILAAHPRNLPMLILFILFSCIDASPIFVLMSASNLNTELEVLDRRSKISRSCCCLSAASLGISKFDVVAFPLPILVIASDQG